jgi:hypothetical protein
MKIKHIHYNDQLVTTAVYGITDVYCDNSMKPYTRWQNAKLLFVKAGGTYIATTAFHSVKLNIKFTKGNKTHPLLECVR